MDFNATIFERELRSAIIKRRDEIAVQIVSGNGVADFNAYRNLQGYVAAFQEVLEMADAVNAKLLKIKE